MQEPEKRKKKIKGAGELGLIGDYDLRELPKRLTKDGSENSRGFGNKKQIGSSLGGKFKKPEDNKSFSGVNGNINNRNNNDTPKSETLRARENRRASKQFQKSGRGAEILDEVTSEFVFGEEINEIPGFNLVPNYLEFGPRKSLRIYKNILRKVRQGPEDRVYKKIPLRRLMGTKPWGLSINGNYE